MVDLTFNDTVGDDRTILAVRGDVDIATAPAMRTRLLEAINSGVPQVVVDLSDVDFMDSTGLGVLVGALKRMRQREGSLAVVLPDGPVHKIFEVTGLLDVFGVVPSVDDVSDPA